MFPNGWYVIHAGDGLIPGTRKRAQLLCTELEIAREVDGAVTVTDADGRVLAVHQIAGAVLVWHGAGAPAWRVGPFPELDGRRWTPVHWLPSGEVHTTVENAQRDVLDNAHFGPVHGLREADTRAHRYGHALDTVSQGIVSLRRIGGPPLLAHLRLNGRLHGPGVLVYRTTLTIGFQIRNLVFSAVTPATEEDRCVFFAGVAVRRLPLPFVNQMMVRTTAKGLLLDYEADAAYWAAGRVRPAEAGPVTEEDRRLAELYDDWLAQYLDPVPLA
jgi:hypothetical protein